VDNIEFYLQIEDYKKYKLPVDTNVNIITFDLHQQT